MQGTKQVHEHDVYIGNNVRSSGPAPTNSWDLTSFAQNYFVIGAFFGALAVLGSYWLLWRPLNRIRDLSDVGFRHLRDESRRRGISLKSLVNEVRARKRIGQVPPIYPNGWFALVESRDLARGSVKSVSAIGHNFAVFRDHNGDAFVLDAYCPHLGADLSVGGKVKGSCIECPFHGWRFNGHNGECVHIPYSEKVPSVAKVKKWTSLEQTGWIFIWFHAEGEEPSWTPPRVEEIHDGRWVYRGRTEHFINSHIQDVPENGGDIAHLNQVHSPSLLAGVDLRYMYDRIWEFAQHHWIASWKEGEAPDSHTAGLNLTHTMKIFGKITVFNMNVHAKQVTIFKEVVAGKLISLCTEEHMFLFLHLGLGLIVLCFLYLYCVYLFCVHRLVTSLAWGSFCFNERTVSLRILNGLKGVKECQDHCIYIL